MRTKGQGTDANVARSMPSRTYCKTCRTANLVRSSTTDNIQEHCASLDIGGHGARKEVGRDGMLDVPAGALELATSFHTTGACTDMCRPGDGEKSVLESRGLALEVDSGLERD